eukprot:jgi/Chlat1/1111/Chrsp110S01552
MESLDWEETGVDGVQVREFGRSDVQLFRLRHGGLEMEATNWGCVIRTLKVPDRNVQFAKLHAASNKSTHWLSATGNTADIVLGLDELTPYTDGSVPYFGAIVGRVANRIAKGKFTLGGVEYILHINNGPNSLHGGKAGFDKRVWQAEPFKAEQGVGVRLKYTSKDGEEGYPGTVETTVEYILQEGQELAVHMRATTDKATPINLAQHSYFNLAGHDAGDILKHELEIKASGYTPVDGTLIPLGHVANVEGTLFDFRTKHIIGNTLAKLHDGYDHNYALDGEAGSMRHVATVSESISGRVMELHTTAPGMQFYTGNFLDGSAKGKGGARYSENAALCLETQGYPDAVNQPSFPSVLVRPGETYQHDMLYRFSTL